MADRKQNVNNDVTRVNPLATGQGRIQEFGKEGGGGGGGGGAGGS